MQGMRTLGKAFRMALIFLLMLPILITGLIPRVLLGQLVDWRDMWEDFIDELEYG